jgi:hypothetical protein
MMRVKRVAYSLAAKRCRLVTCGGRIIYSEKYQSAHIKRAASIVVVSVSRGARGRTQRVSQVHLAPEDADRPVERAGQLLYSAGPLHLTAQYIKRD